MTNWKDELKKVEQCPQRQDSTIDQLIDLYLIANKFGFYDAADFIKNTIQKKCNIGMEYENCSSREYGLSCTTCINFV